MRECVPTPARENVCECPCMCVHVPAGIWAPPVSARAGGIMSMDIGPCTGAVAWRTWTCSCAHLWWKWRHDHVFVHKGRRSVGGTYMCTVSDITELPGTAGQFPQQRNWPQQVGACGFSREPGRGYLGWGVPCSTVPKSQALLANYLSLSACPKPPDSRLPPAPWGSIFPSTHSLATRSFQNK